MTRQICPSRIHCCTRLSTIAHPAAKSASPNLTAVVGGNSRQDTCPFRKLNPTVLTVKSAQDVASDDAAATLNGSAMWGIFLQAEMGPCRVVIGSVFLQD